MQTSTLAISANLIILLALFAGIVVLQIYLSKKDNKWVGLILPFISFGISLLALLAVLLFSAHTGSIIGSAIYIFLLYNIPTGVLLAIYAGCRGKKKRQRDLEKMSVQDL